MVKRKQARKRAATRTVYRTRTVKTHHHRAKSGTQYIPGAMATVAAVAVNASLIKNTASYITNKGSAKLTDYPTRMVNLVTGNGTWAKQMDTAIVKQIVPTAIAMAGGYVAGEVVKKYAPNVIKKPLGKISKIVPRVIN